LIIPLKLVIFHSLLYVYQRESDENMEISWDSMEVSMENSRCIPIRIRIHNTNDGKTLMMEN
jgi:hypothetical protein